MTKKSILFDPARCIGCRACQVACKQWNDLSGEKTTNWGSYENPSDLSAQTKLKLIWTEVERKGKVEWLFTLRVCLHCHDAACEEACPSDAISHTEEGFVVIDPDMCIGCGLCIEACPFDTPRLLEGSDNPIATKCDGCISRQVHGEDPACVKACPTYALIFGDRPALLATGAKRVEELCKQGHSNATLYGNQEMEGLNILSVLDDVPVSYGLPESP
jgi:formate dehydrogenase iron-sulfur subunit